MTDEPVKVLFLGCRYEERGHETFFNGESITNQTYYAPECPWPTLDSEVLAPIGKQGSGRLTHKDGWTALGISDYTVDDRPGSRMVFAINKPDQTLHECFVEINKIPAYVALLSRVGTIRIVTKEVNS